MTSSELDERGPGEGLDRAHLLRLLSLLDDRGYDFIAPTPASQARVAVRADRQQGRNVADLLGWNLPCDQRGLDELAELLDGAGLLDHCAGGLVKSRVRVSRVFGNLFVHSGYPTQAQDSVFLGPDSHRFADYILRNIAGMPGAASVLDYGAGAGVGGITAASHLEGATLTLADINPTALALASINAEHAGLDYEPVRVEHPAILEQTFDLIVMHPPFMIDADRRTYRDGGDLYGGRLSVDWAMAGLVKLRAGGRLLMHTGVSIVDGRDMVAAAICEALPTGFTLDYRLLDPDIYGDELDNPEYAEVDRIAAVGLCITREPRPA